MLPMIKKCAIKVRNYLASTKLISFKTKLDFDLLLKPGYGYGTYYAGLQAKALGIEEICVIEFGVAGGYGLTALEEIASEVENKVGVRIKVYGFDMGSGMPEPQDYRDMPYIWKSGYFKMDIDLLKSRLKKAKIYLGDVKNTIDLFTKDNSTPIGFISFDLDYYSSTVEALKLLEQSNDLFLPRVFCYFDDCVGDDLELHSEFTGELLAIKEFNQKSEKRKIAKINAFQHKRIFNSGWNEKMFVLHIFDHPLQCQHVNPRKDWQMPILK
jgi:hypothetical protein